jgi:hypothetical protein
VTRTLIFTANDGTRLWRSDDGKWCVQFKAGSTPHGRRMLPVHSFTVTVNDEGTRLDTLHVDTMT